MNPTRRLVALPLLLAAGCAGLVGRGTPESQPAARPGWRAYAVGALGFEAPSDWEASGDARRLSLVPPEGSAKLEAWAACLAAGETALRDRDGGLERVQRHHSTLGGRPALEQEADQGGTHGWAYLACAGNAQHWLTFTGRSPVSQRLLEAWREVVRSASLEAPR
jgi:hypothetical protein